MKVVFDGQNLEEIEGREVFLPRPLRGELLKKILKRAKKVFMPPSTYQRVRRDLRERYREKIEIMSLRGRYGRYDPETIAKILALRKAGLSIREIAREVELPKSTVHYIISRLRKLDVGEKLLI